MVDATVDSDERGWVLTLTDGNARISATLDVGRVERVGEVVVCLDPGSAEALWDALGAALVPYIAERERARAAFNAGMKPPGITCEMCDGRGWLYGGPGETSRQCDECHGKGTS